MLMRSDDLRKIVGDRPLLVAKRARNLNDTLVQSEIVRPANKIWLTDMACSLVAIAVLGNLLTALRHSGTQNLNMSMRLGPSLIGLHLRSCIFWSVHARSYMLVKRHSVRREILTQCFLERKNPGSSSSKLFGLNNEFEDL